MGLTIQSCSCLKKSDEESTEFRHKIVQNNLKSSNQNLFTISQKITSDKNNEEQKNKTFSFSQIKNHKNNKKPEITIQAVARAYLFRKHFYCDKGLKYKLFTFNEENIKKKESEFIPDNLLETDKLIKKDLNDDFLLKLGKKDLTKNEKFHVKTDCLITKLNGEDCLYKGDLDVDGNFNGYGELYLKSGKKYEGKFVDGKLNGYGRLIDLFGIKCYEGNFKDNQLLDGKGKIIKIENGEKAVYEGDIKNMKKEGKGIEKTKDYIYFGDFRDDLRHGKGKMTFNEEDEFYEGEFVNDKMTGKGFYKWSNKNTYEGDFLNGMLHGKGLYKWADGNEYEGDYVNNIREGEGEYRWKNGKVYKGPYKNGKQNGTGIIKNSKGETMEVEYIDGKIVKKKDNKPSKRDFSLKDEI